MESSTFKSIGATYYLPEYLVPSSTIPFVRCRAGFFISSVNTIVGMEYGPTGLYGIEKNRQEN